MSNWCGDSIVDEDSIHYQIAQETELYFEVSWDGLGGRWFPERIGSKGDIKEISDSGSDRVLEVDEDVLENYPITYQPFSPHNNV